MKATLTIGIRRYAPGMQDAHGNVVDAHLPAADLSVYAVAPLDSTEPVDGRSGSVTRCQVLAPPGTSADHRDLFVIDGAEWQMDGEVADYTRGPYGARLGVAFKVWRSVG